MNAIASIVLLNKLIPKIGRVFTIFITVLLGAMIIGLTQFRNTVSVTKGQERIIDLTDTLQVYLGGIYNVAISLETADFYNLHGNIMLFLFDILRSTLGFNLILKHFDINTTSMLFNERLYFSDHVAQIIPMIGQSYFFVGTLLAPILLVLFIVFARKLLTFIDKSYRIEIIFLLTISASRIGFSMGQNGSILMNDISFFLMLNLSVYYLNNKISLRNKIFKDV